MKQEQQQAIVTQSGLFHQHIQTLSPNSSISNGGGSGPTSPLQVVPQGTMESSNTINIATQSVFTPQSSRHSGIQDLKIQHSAPILMTGNGTPTLSATNPSSKKIILQPLNQPSNIILTSGGQPILLQATNPGKLSLKSS